MKLKRRLDKVYFSGMIFSLAAVFLAMFSRLSFPAQAETLEKIDDEKNAENLVLAEDAWLAKTETINNYTEFEEAYATYLASLPEETTMEGPTTPAINRDEWPTLTARLGRVRYTAKYENGKTINREETYYDLDMKKVLKFCNAAYYEIRDDGAKIDPDGYILVAADLNRYPRCSIVETSLGLGKVYDTGTFALMNPEQFDLATDWTRSNGI